MEENYRAEYEQLYRAHWWWRAREAILIGVLRRRRPKPGAAILDVGCGNALSFAALAEFGTVRGIEVDARLLDDSRPVRAHISTEPLGAPLYDDPRWRFDVITALDVLEHIDDDRHALASMAGMLNPGGLMVITVPAFELLWDRHDTLNHHRRRYTARGLKRSLAACGVDVIELRYLFPRCSFPSSWFDSGIPDERGKWHSTAFPVPGSIARSSASAFWRSGCSVVCRSHWARPCWPSRKKRTSAKPHCTVTRLEWLGRPGSASAPL